MYQVSCLALGAGHAKSDDSLLGEASRLRPVSCHQSGPSPAGDTPALGGLRPKIAKT